MNNYTARATFLRCALFFYDGIVSKKYPILTIKNENDIMEKTRKIILHVIFARHCRVTFLLQGDSSIVSSP